MIVDIVPRGRSISETHVRGREHAASQPPTFANVRTTAPRTQGPLVLHWSVRKWFGSCKPRSTGTQVPVADRHSPLPKTCRQHFRTAPAAAVGYSV
jgi:hypothetical protein